MARYTALAVILSIALVPVRAEDHSIAEAEAAFVFGKLKTERLQICHDGQCVPAIHAAELAFARTRQDRTMIRVLPPAPPKIAPKQLPTAQVCPSGKCTCGCKETGECICRTTSAPAASPSYEALPENGCRYVTINGQKVKVCPNQK